MTIAAKLAVDHIACRRDLLRPLSSQLWRQVAGAESEHVATTAKIREARRDHRREAPRGARCDWLDRTERERDGSTVQDASAGELLAAAVRRAVGDARRPGVDAASAPIERARQQRGRRSTFPPATRSTTSPSRRPSPRGADERGTASKDVARVARRIDREGLGPTTAIDDRGPRTTTPRDDHERRGGYGV